MSERYGSEESSYINTLNNMGFMITSLDKYSQAFVKFSATAKHAVLDVGAAYGVASIAALKAGAKVIANDVDDRHLEILKSQVAELDRVRLTTYCSTFPHLQIKSSSLAAVLACRVLHFLDGNSLELGASRIYDWLIPGGKVFIVATTPWVGQFQSFIPIYEARQRAGDLYPGLLENVSSVAPKHGEFLPSQIHFLDVTVLSRVFVNAGFVIEDASVFARPDYPTDIQLDGRENVGLVASKHI